MVRIYQSQPLLENANQRLDETAFNHLVRALRMKVGESVILFDGTNRILPAIITCIDKKTIEVKTEFFQSQDHESPLKIELGQVISRGEKMEFTIQKAVELGVHRIVPLISARCGVKLDPERLFKKQLQWQKIAQSACEQCGRNQIPEVAPAMLLEDWCAELNINTKLTLQPSAAKTLRSLDLNLVQDQSIALLIGSEGGLTEQEVAMTLQHSFLEVQLGKRILRTETAALAMIAMLQCLYGDLA